jgi:ATP-dependent RNA circularization protein (DNA/RNA ligase family)
VAARDLTMFIKYEKTFRVPISQIRVPGKLILSGKELQLLLAGKVEIDEKMDGANAGIIRHKKGFSLQKRGSLVGQSEHEQFQYFHAWANRMKYDNIMSVPPWYLIYGELLYAVHTIYYDSLPDYFLVFDILDLKKDHWMCREEKEDFCGQFGFDIVPLVAEGYFNIDDLYDLMPKESAFGEVAEGMVIKRYRKKEYLRGKIVKPQFIKTIEESEHWTKYNIRKNKLRKK